MPPATAEIKHRHARTSQFFYVLDGTLVLQLETGPVSLGPNEGLEVPPGIVHQARNDSTADTAFLVISTPPVGQDRENLD